MTDTASLDFRNTQPLQQQQEDDQLSKRARADVCDAWRLSLCNACAAIWWERNWARRRGRLHDDTGKRTNKQVACEYDRSRKQYSQLALIQKQPESARKSPPNERPLDQDNMVASKRPEQMQGAGRWEEMGFVKYLLILPSNQGTSHCTRLRTNYPGRVRKTQAASGRSS